MTRDDIHTTADHFLRAYLSQSGSKPEPVQIASSVSTVPNVAASRAAAKDFIAEHLNKLRTNKKGIERYAIDEPQRVILSRRIGNVTSHFYGWKNSDRCSYMHSIWRW